MAPKFRMIAVGSVTSGKSESFFTKRHTYVAILGIKPNNLWFTPPMFRCMSHIDFPHFVEDYIFPSSHTLCGLRDTIATIRLRQLRVARICSLHISGKQRDVVSLETKKPAAHPIRVVVVICSPRACLYVAMVKIFMLGYLKNHSKRNA